MLLRLYRTEFGLIDYIDSSAQNDGSYSWEIPSNRGPGDDYQVRITSTSDPSIGDYSDGEFTIPSTAQPDDDDTNFSEIGASWTDD